MSNIKGVRIRMAEVEVVSRQFRVLATQEIATLGITTLVSEQTWSYTPLDLPDGKPMDVFVLSMVIQGRKYSAETTVQMEHLQKESTTFTFRRELVKKGIEAVLNSFLRDQL